MGAQGMTVAPEGGESGLSVMARALPVIRIVAPDGAYDLIIVDAFSSDAIPIHLMTREAMALYVSKLSPNGMVVMVIEDRELLGTVYLRARYEVVSLRELLARRCSGSG